MKLNRLFGFLLVMICLFLLLPSEAFGFGKRCGGGNGGSCCGAGGCNVNPQPSPNVNPTDQTFTFESAPAAASLPSRVWISGILFALQADNSYKQEGNASTVRQTANRPEPLNFPNNAPAVSGRFQVICGQNGCRYIPVQ
jgi:hypothetical protein